MNIDEALRKVRIYTARAPVDVRGLAQSLGIRVVELRLPENISGAIRARNHTNTEYEIVVNSEHSEVRKRFTIAHELGHHIYHRDLLGRGVGDTRAYRAEGTEYPNPHITWREERQANTFAANVLMPEVLVSHYRHLGMSPRALASKFNVSEQAMRIRLGLD